MVSNRPIIEDERGRRVRVVQRLDKLPMWPWKHGRVEIGTTTLRYQRAYTIACVVCLLAAIAFMWMWDHAVMKKHGVPFTAALVIVLAPSWTVGVLAFLHWRRRGRRMSARIIASKGVCPVCETDISEAIAEADGLTTCPRCAAAWKVGVPLECPTCEYDLRGVPASIEGVTTCPECSATWVPTGTEPVPSPR